MLEYDVLSAQVLSKFRFVAVDDLCRPLSMNYRDKYRSVKEMSPLEAFVGCLWDAMALSLHRNLKATHHTSRSVKL
jgi:hypothetical protein